jgi:hypothetical protein
MNIKKGISANKEITAYGYRNLLSLKVPLRGI